MTSHTPHLNPYSDGPADGDVLFFIQGWPDDHSLWDGLVGALSDRYRCVRVDLPNYPGAEQRRWGYAHEAIVEALVKCIREVSPDKPVTLVAHDWGAYWAYRLHHAHEALVSRIVGLDIAPHIQPKLYEVPLIAAYQLWLASAFVAGGPVGDWMTRRFASIAGAPEQHTANAKLNYPYFYTWRDVFTGRAAKALRGYWPDVPLLFAYGVKKPMRFHSDRWLTHVRSRPGNAVLELEKSGHWVTRDPRLSGEVRSWLDETPAQA